MSSTRRAMSMFSKNRSSLFVPTVLIALVVVIALLVPLMPLRDPLDQDFSTMLEPPNVHEPMGTDHLGRSVVSRVLWGSRLSLTISSWSLVIGGLLGITAGLIAGYFEGSLLGSVSSMVIDALLSFPTIIVAIIVITISGGGRIPLILAIAVTLVPRFGRVIRGNVLSLKNNEYVVAARALGASNVRIMINHVLINTVSQIVIYAAIHFPYAIFVESSLSFLGIGVPPDIATWGRVIADGRQYLQIAPWISFFPGVAIAATAIGFNLLGDSLRDLLDPKIGSR